MTSKTSVVSVMAPGSTIAEQNPQAAIGTGNFVGTGTSFSSAITAGAAALLLSKQPTVAPNDVKARLLGSGTVAAVAIAKFVMMMELASALLLCSRLSSGWRSSPTRGTSSWPRSTRGSKPSTTSHEPSLFSLRVDEAMQGGSRAAVMLMDLDRFNDVNDTLGHHYGDLLLTEVASRLAGTVGDVATAARLGGDEFAILLPDIDEVGSEEVGGRILNEFDRRFLVDGVYLD